MEHTGSVTPLVFTLRVTAPLRKALVWGLFLLWEEFSFSFWSFILSIVRQKPQGVSRPPALPHAQHLRDTKSLGVQALDSKSDLRTHANKTKTKAK